MSVILDGTGSPVCILETISVEIHPFNEVGEQHAWEEGEGDRSLEFWREVIGGFSLPNALKLTGSRTSGCRCAANGFSSAFRSLLNHERNVSPINSLGKSSIK